MWEAAPARHTRALTPLLAFILWCCACASAPPATAQQGAGAEIWAAELTRGQAKSLNDRSVDALARAGVNAIIIDRSRLDRHARQRVRDLADRGTMLLIDVASRKRLHLCNSSFARPGKRACALLVGSVKPGMPLGRLRGAPLMVIRVRGAADVRMLAATRVRGRVIALVRLGGPRGLSLADWRTAVKLMKRADNLDLGAAAGTSSPTVTQYFGDLERARPELANPPSSVPVLPPLSTPIPLPTASLFPPALDPFGLTDTPSEATTTANVWRDADGGTCKRSSSPVSYSDADACSTLRNAYIAASLGDTVRIKCGTYAGETMNGATTSKGSPDSVLARVVYRPEDNSLGCVNITGNLNADVPHVEFHKLTISGSFGCAYRSEMSQTKGGNCQMIDSDVAAVTMGGVFNFRIARNDIGGTQNADGIEIGAYPAFDGHHPRNGIIEDNVIHDLADVGPTEPHIDGLQFTAGEDIIVRRNVFKDIAHQGLFAQPDAGPINRITIENNLFRDILGGFAVWLKNKPGHTCTENVINYNTSDNGFTASTVADERCSGTMTGNIWPSLSSGGCASWLATFTVSYMVFGSGSTCGSNGYVLPSGFNAAFIDTATNNYHLSASSEARGKGNPSVCPATDIDGVTRPGEGASTCDAGFDEVP